MAGESLADWTLTPIATAAEVRAFSGYKETTDVSDADVNAFILKAQGSTLSAIADRVRVPLWGVIDGVNTRFALPPRFLHRVLFDADASGGEANDLVVSLEGFSVGRVPPGYTAGTVSAVDALNGIVTLSAAPASATVRRIHLFGWVMGHAVNKQDFKTAVLALASHWVDVQVRGPGRLPLGNPAAGNKEGVDSRGAAWMMDWERLTALMRRGRARAAAVKTAIGRLGLGRVECDDYAPDCG